MVGAGGWAMCAEMKAEHAIIARLSGMHAIRTPRLIISDTAELNHVPSVTMPVLQGVAWAVATKQKPRTRRGSDTAVSFPT